MGHLGGGGIQRCICRSGDVGLSLGSVKTLLQFDLILICFNLILILIWFWPLLQLAGQAGDLELVRVNLRSCSQNILSPFSSQTVGKYRTFRKINYILPHSFNHERVWPNVIDSLKLLWKILLYISPYLILSSAQAFRSVDGRPYIKCAFLSIILMQMHL